MDLTCSEISARDEPLEGTAGSGRRWLCLEHPGPWGADVVASGALGELTGQTAQWAQLAGARLLCVRRPGARRGLGRAQRLLLAATEPEIGRSQARELVVGDLRELLDLDSERVFPGAGECWPERFWDRGREWKAVRPALVCAHGRRDRCCAVKGRPVASALAAAGQDVWECSHTGGHRFAPSIVLLPEGSVYGRLAPSEAVAVAEAAARGQLALEGLRGRTCWTDREQVAEIAVRRELDCPLESLRLRGREDGGVDVVAGMRGGGERRFLVAVQSEKLPPRPTSCGAEPKPVVALRCVGISELTEACDSTD